MDKKSVLLTGPHSIAAVLKHQTGRLRNVYYLATADQRRFQQLLNQAREQGVNCQALDRTALDKICAGERHQGLVADFEPANLLAEKDLPGLIKESRDGALFLILDNVQDPHNLGACIRSADAAGATAVIFPRDKSAPLSAVARRAAAGAAEVLPVIEVTNLARVLRLLKSHGIWIAGTSEQATETVYEARLSGPLALVLGNEGSGMRQLTSKHCDYLVKIPMQGTVPSLNVSVATAVCLFEIQRQRRNGVNPG